MEEEELFLQPLPFAFPIGTMRSHSSAPGLLSRERLSVNVFSPGKGFFPELFRSGRARRKRTDFPLPEQISSPPETGGKYRREVEFPLKKHPFLTGRMPLQKASSFFRMMGKILLSRPKKQDNPPSLLIHAFTQSWMRLLPIVSGKRENKKQGRKSYRLLWRRKNCRPFSQEPVRAEFFPPAGNSGSAGKKKRSGLSPPLFHNRIQTL